MLRILTSLTFLYAFSIGILLLFGFLYYKSFIKNGYQKRIFPIIFFLIGIVCFSFLYFNIHAPLQLKTFSNLDHHFIRHDGFVVTKEIELGKSDTANYRNNSFNRFLLFKENNVVKVVSSYSEEPFYLSTENSYKILSNNYSAANHAVSFKVDAGIISINTFQDTSFQLSINKVIVSKASKTVRKGLNAWNIFKDELSFINSVYYTNESIVTGLSNVFLLRDDVSREVMGELKYFLSGKLFERGSDIKYDGKALFTTNVAFNATISDKASIAWGVGFLDNNRNQFVVNYGKADSFILQNRYPVSYPLSEEQRSDWTKHSVNKFLVADSRDVVNMSGVFEEGFLFAPFSRDSTINFSPVLLSYQKDEANKPLELQARFLNGKGKLVPTTNSQFILPAKSADFSWSFTIQNSFEWKLGNKTFSPTVWQPFLFGSLFLFFIVVFISSWLKPANKISWIWQLLSSITLVLLTTRFFFYWRYKSFPPYEGLDLPSVQQLNSFWNFGIIIITTILLSIIFGYSLFHATYLWGRKKIALLLNKSYYPNYNEDIIEAHLFSRTINRISFIKKIGLRAAYFISWLLILLAGGGFAFLNKFDPTTCRHLAILLTLCYFIYIYISYKFSPLVISSDKSWWSISTRKWIDIVISNPVKVLLSISLLGLFAFVDIGFAIIFLNFLLFNEAFLCINFSIAGLSAGSKKNAAMFAIAGFIYLSIFIFNLIYGPYLFNYLLDLPQLLYMTSYVFFAIIIGYLVVRLLFQFSKKKRIVTSISSAIFIFIIAFLFFPKERILEKASITKYRIDVMTMPVDKAIEVAYKDGKTYEPVIRAAQNQWFINTFIYEKNNPGVNSVGFNLLPHAPQNKGAKYNAQATDLITSRFFLAEHGKWSVLLYVLLLLVPTTLLASFYKLYPDFTNRINNNYPTITTGFSLLNYLTITALLVILAATGRYIFFGQDLPFGSILSKQSILFPSMIIVSVILLFKKIPLEQYPNRKKFIPGLLVFAGLGLLLFLVKPVFNKDKEFGVADIAKNMDNYLELRLQPLIDYFESSTATRRLSISKKDQLFSDSLRKLISTGYFNDADKLFSKEIEAYSRTSFSRHIDQAKLLYLNLYSGRPQLGINENYFRVEPPPHLQQFWTGNVYGDSTEYNISLWNSVDASLINRRISSYTNEQSVVVGGNLELVFKEKIADNNYNQLCLVNTASSSITIKSTNGNTHLKKNDSLFVRNPDRLLIIDSITGKERILTIAPDAFMKNYYVNGNRFYVYPMREDFIWARNFSESIAGDYTGKGLSNKNVFVSLNGEIMDSLSIKIKTMMSKDTTYKKGAEYGICIADGNGRLIAINDFIKGIYRPDPNDKAGFNTAIRGENGFISQSLLRKEIGNINLLRMNPGPGSTLKPIIFSAIASQLNLDWDAFAAEGFSEKQQYFGGEKVGEYDFEKNNGRITKVSDYLKYSDNYYHANLLLLGSYSKQSLKNLLANHFATQNPDGALHWPYFSYNGKQYWLNGFQNWPGYINGKANFGSDSSFVSVGLFNNYGIYTFQAKNNFDKFSSDYDSSLFMNAGRKSGFILPEYGLFDQKGTGMDNSKPNEVFLSSFRGHVKGSSQVMVPPVKMLDAFGKLVSQNKNYSLTLNPYANENQFSSFYTGEGVAYNNYLSIIREKVFVGLREALQNGTAARLGTMLKNGSPYYYYAKTGTTGDDELKVKSKLFVIIISQKDVTDPNFNFRKNKFYTIYFTSQHGPAKQNEEFQAAIIKYVQQSPAFIKYMQH